MAVVSIQTGYLWICDCGAPVGYWIPSNGWDEPTEPVVLLCQGCNERHEITRDGDLWVPVEKIRVKPPYGQDFALLPEEV